jgi:hypothetical protein
MPISPLQLTVGVGSVWVAPADTAFPTADQTPPQASTSWMFLGQTDKGITISLTQKIVEIYVDQETAPVKAIRTQENMMLKTDLAIWTLENLGKILNNQTVVATPQAAGARGIKEMAFYRGKIVNELAWIFEGDSRIV